MPKLKIFINLFILIGIIINLNSASAEWKYITPVKMPCYAVYCDEENFIAGYTFMGIRKFNIKPAVWEDVSYNLIGLEIHSISGNKSIGSL